MKIRNIAIRKEFAGKNGLFAITNSGWFQSLLEMKKKEADAGA